MSERIDWENQEWDFYYSDKQFVLTTIFSPPSLGGKEIEPGRVSKVKINGKWKTFTERVQKGKGPFSKFDDIVFVGTGKKTKDEYLSEKELEKLSRTMAIKMRNERIKKEQMK